MYDVIIVGSGPSGCTAAKTLADMGKNVLLLEKMPLPRYKSCSGQLISKSIKLVKKYFNADVPVHTMCQPTENKGIIFTDDKGKAYKFEQSGLNIWRSHFDKWLADMAADAGATIRDSSIVLDCQENNDCVSVSVKCGQKIYTEKCSYVIDCEGITGHLKPKLTGKRTPLITTYQTYNQGNIDLDYHYFYAYLQPELSEYDAWFNVKDNQLVLGVSVKNPQKVQYYHSKFLEYMCENHALKIDKVIKCDRWLMPEIQPGCPLDLGRGRIFFAGEIAGFLNPMGEGISCGMESGHAIAAAISSNFGNTEQIYTDYKKQTQDLKGYILRQWAFVGSAADTFSTMR